MKSACPKRLDYWFVRPCVYISNQTLSCMSCPNSTIPTELMLSVRLQILWWMLDRSLSCTSQSPPHTLCRLPGREFISSAVIQKDKRKDRANLKPVYCLFWAEGQFPWCSICRQGSARSYSVCDCECTVSLIEDFLLSHTELPDVLKEKKSEERESIHESDLLRWLQIALFFSSSPLGLVAVLFFFPGSILACFLWSDMRRWVHTGVSLRHIVPPARGNERGLCCSRICWAVITWQLLLREGRHSFRPHTYSYCHHESYHQPLTDEM